MAKENKTTGEIAVYYECQNIEGMGHCTVSPPPNGAKKLTRTGWYCDVGGEEFTDEEVMKKRCRGCVPIIK